MTIAGVVAALIVAYGAGLIIGMVVGSFVSNLNNFTR